MTVVVSPAGTGDVLAQDRSTEGALDLARSALADERFHDAVEHADVVIEGDPDNVEALLVRARAYLFGDPARPDDAGRDIEHVLELEPDNPAARELDVWRDYRYGASFLLPFRTSDRLRRARDIVESDSTRRLAHLVAGLIRYSDFRDSYQTVRFRSFTTPGRAVGVDDDIADAAAYLFRTEVDLDDGEPELSFRDPMNTGYRMDYTPLADAEQKFAREAITHLGSAAGPDEVGITAHRYLAEILVRTDAPEEGIRAASRLIESAPERPEGWMFRGMFRVRSGDYRGADADFAAAFDRSDERTQRAMTTPRMFIEDREGGDPVDSATGVTAGVAADRAYWLESDPLWSTEANEALLEHVARMVEADLRYGDPSGDTPGWDTDAGGVFVRYGPPLITARYSSLTEGYMLLHYGDRRFMFMMPGRRGTYTFYSPSATEFQGARSNIRQWESDQEIASREAFREEPRRSNVLDGRRMDLSAVPTRFGGASPSIAVAWCLPDLGTDDAAGDVIDEAALFVLRPASERPERVAVVRGPETASDRRATPSDTGISGCPASVIEAPATDGPARYSLEVTAGERAGVFRFDGRKENAASPAGEVTMSDLMPASLVVERTSSGPSGERSDVLRRPENDVYPAGKATFARGSDLYLYFELYGTGASAPSPISAGIQAALVPAGDPSGVSDHDPGRLERLFGGIFNRSETAPVSVDFTEQISSPDMHRYLILRTDDLEPGRYVVAVRITIPASGASVQSSREIEISARD